MNQVVVANHASSWGEVTMNALETIMWRGESDRLKSTIVSLEILDSSPDWREFRAVHERAVRRVPRLRQRVIESPMNIAAPRWSPDPLFDLHFHLRRSRLPDGATWQDLFDSAEQVAMSPFDRSRSPWEATLYEGLPGGRAAYLLKLHHASTDGMGIVQLLTQLHTSTSRSVEPLEPEDWSASPEPTPLKLIAAEIIGTVRAAPSSLGRAHSVLRQVVDRPGASLTAGIRYGQSLQRMLTPPEADPSPLLEQRSTNWRFAALDVDLPALRKSAKLVGGSLNDAYLAGLLGGYRLYHEAFDLPIESLPMSIPISVRRADDSAGGNRIASARLAGPVGTADPTERMRTIGDLVRRARNEPALDNLTIVAPFLAKLPSNTITSLVTSLMSGNDLQASNVPGTETEVYLAGAKVERLYPFAPLPGCPAMITMLSYGTTCCVGVNYDSASFKDADLFVQCLVQGFAEVIAVASPGSRALVRRVQ